MKDKGKSIKLILIYFMAALLIVADQITKYFSSTMLPLNQEQPVIDGFFYLTNCRNTGAAWSLFSGKVDILAYVSLVAAVLVALLIFYSKYTLLSVSFGMMLAGAVGNMIDRFRLGYVNDFLDFVIFGYDFPVFNVADICVVVGGMLMILAVLLHHKEQELFTRPAFMKKRTENE